LYCLTDFLSCETIFGNVLSNIVLVPEVFLILASDWSIKLHRLTNHRYLKYIDIINKSTTSSCIRMTSGINTTQVLRDSFSGKRRII
jgi:hypothetical protein